MVAIVTRESVEELGLEAGMSAAGRRQVDLGDGGAMRRGLALRRDARRRVALVAGFTATRADGARDRATRRPRSPSVFPRVAPSSSFQFAGSNQLAFQIRHGAPADVFASASPVYTQELYREGLVEKPSLFATNSLVLAVPRSNPAKIRTVSRPREAAEAEARRRRSEGADRPLHA